MSQAKDSNMGKIATSTRALCDAVITSGIKETDETRTWREMLQGLLRMCRSAEECQAALDAMTKHRAAVEKKHAWIKSSSLSKRYSMLRKPFMVAIGRWEGKKAIPVMTLAAIYGKKGWHKAYAFINESYPSSQAKPGLKADSGKDRKAADKGKAGAKGQSVEKLAPVAPDEVEAQARHHVHEILASSPTELATVAGKASLTAVYNCLVMCIQRLEQSDNPDYAEKASAAKAAIEVVAARRRAEAKKLAEPRVVGEKPEQPKGAETVTAPKKAKPVLTAKEKKEIARLNRKAAAASKKAGDGSPLHAMQAALAKAAANAAKQKAAA